MQYEDSSRSATDPEVDEFGRPRPETEEDAERMGETEPELVESDRDESIVIGEAEQVGEPDRLDSDEGEPVVLGEAEPVAESERLEPDEVDEALVAETTEQHVQVVEAEPVYEPEPADVVEPVEADRDEADRDAVDAAVAAGELGGVREAEVVEDALPYVSDDDSLRGRWHRAQHQFVDDPPQAVREAASLVQEAAERASAAIHTTSSASAADGNHTEQLRVAMQRYHKAFEELLAISGDQGSETA